jgi:hypothetical protein
MLQDLNTIRKNPHKTRGSVGWVCSTCREDSVLSFLKAEWKVSDTDSAHWASSFIWVFPDCVEILQHYVLYLLLLVSVHMAKQFQRRRFFRNRPIRNKNCMWWPCLLTDQDEMSNLLCLLTDRDEQFSIFQLKL